MTHKMELALRGSQTRNASKTEKQGSTSSSQNYSLPVLTAMPSTERSGSISRVVSYGGRLFAVGYYAGGAA